MGAARVAGRPVWPARSGGGLLDRRPWLARPGPRASAVTQRRV